MWAHYHLSSHSCWHTHTHSGTPDRVFSSSYAPPLASSKHAKTTSFLQEQFYDTIYKCDYMMCHSGLELSGIWWTHVNILPGITSSFLTYLAQTEVCEEIVPTHARTRAHIYTLQLFMRTVLINMYLYLRLKTLSRALDIINVSNVYKLLKNP